MGKVVVDSIKVSNHNRQIDGLVYMPMESGIYPVVIFSHGYNGFKTDFDSTARFLAERGICAVTFAFCGGSTRDTSGMSTKDMTIFTEKDDLFAVISYVKELEFINEKQVFLFGGSQGGLVTALVVEDIPDEIRGMILLYPAFCIADDWNKKFPKKEDIPEEFELWDMKLGRVFFESIYGYDVFEHVGKYENPILVMHGEKDAIVSMSYMDKIKRAYKNVHLELFPLEGHGFSDEGTKKMTELLYDFVVMNCIED